MLEEAIINRSHEKYTEAFDGNDEISLLNPNSSGPLVNPEAIKAMLYQHFKYYEGPLLARYMLVIQIYSVFERYSIKFAKMISHKDQLLSIKDLNGGQNFIGIKTYYSKVCDINYQYWSELDTLRQVRNIIAHCDGYVTYSEQKGKILKLSESDADLLVLDDDRLALNEEFIKRSLRAVVRFFDIVEAMASEPDNKLDFSWGHINQFRSFDLDSKKAKEI